MQAANQEAAANRRHAGQSNGSDNFSVAVQSTEILPVYHLFPQRRPLL